MWVLAKTNKDSWMWFHLYYGQVKSLRLYEYNHTTDYPEYRRAWGKLAFVYLLPVVFAVWAFCRSDVFKGVSDLTVGVLGLLTGALLAVFSQLSGWRDRYPSDDGERTWSREPTRRLLDTSATQMLAACQSSLNAIIILVFATVWGMSPSWVGRPFAAVTVLFTMHAVCSMIVAVPYLYAAYVQVHKVDGKYDGFDATN